MVKLVYLVVKTSRPRQWLKNAATFAALVFSGLLFFPGYFPRVLLSFIVFCGLSSGVYILNDIKDKKEDEKHPFKKKRPVASGELSAEAAFAAAMVILAVTLVAAFVLSKFFFLICLAYVGLNASYMLYLKKIPILDVLSIAAGFILRVYGGAIVVNLHMSVWFLLTVISASLFLAVGKRQSERTLLKGLTGSIVGHRVTLTSYTNRLLDIYTGMFANTTWLTYALFAYQHQFESTRGPIPFIFSLIPKTFVAQKWLMATVPLVIYGVMRYLQLVYEKNQGESPERVLLSDRPLLTAVMIWGIMVIGILYGIG